jgi:catalase
MNSSTNYGNDPNYVNASTKKINFKGKLGSNGQSFDAGHENWVGGVTAYASEMEDKDYEQARGMWEVLGKSGEQEVFIGNVAAHLGGANEEVQRTAVGE